MLNQKIYFPLFLEILYALYVLYAMNVATTMKSRVLNCSAKFLKFSLKILETIVFQILLLETFNKLAAFRTVMIKLEVCVITETSRHQELEK